jgi:peptide/nickel transport system substrate-binding protein
MAFNIHRGPLMDKGLRQKLVASIDAPGLVGRNIGRMGVPAHGLIPPGLLGHEPSRAGRQAAGPSPAPAPAGAEIELTAAVNPVYFGSHSALTRELTNVARSHGFVIRPVNKTIDEFMEAQTRATTDVILGRWIADFPDADNFVYQLDSSGGALGRLCGTREVDRLIERGRLETAAATRHSIYCEIEDILAREALFLPLFYEQSYRFARPEVEGLNVSFWGQTVDYENLRVRG